MSWKDTAEANAAVLNLIIKEMVKNKDKIPTHLVGPVNNISMISSDIEVFVINRLYCSDPILTSFPVVES
jgi:hypothetical protein